MSAHIALPCFTPDDPMPATLMPAMLTGVLRDSLHFDGLVVTDALTMQAIVSRFGAGETAVSAFVAGSDLLLAPSHIGETVEAMMSAIDSGRITMERLDSSVARLLQLKRQVGLLNRRTVQLDSIPAVVGRRSHQDIADDIAARALTLVQAGPIEQFRNSQARTTLILYAEETNHSLGGTLRRHLNGNGYALDAFRLFPTSGPASYDSAQTVIDQSPRALFAVSVRPISGRGHIALPQSLAALITRTARTKPTILASFGSPYLLAQLTDFSGGYLLAWNPVSANEKAVADAVAGGAAISGNTPITLSDRFPRGHGIHLAARQ